MEQYADGYDTWSSMTTNAMTFYFSAPGVSSKGKEGDEVEREIQRDKSGKPTGVRIGYEQESGPGPGYGLYLAAVEESKRTGRPLSEVLNEKYEAHTIGSIKALEYISYMYSGLGVKALVQGGWKWWMGRKVAAEVAAKTGVRPLKLENIQLLRQ